MLTDVRLDKGVTMNDQETEASILESTMAIPPSSDRNSDIEVDDRVRQLSEMNPYRLDHSDKLMYHKSGHKGKFRFTVILERHFLQPDPTTYLDTLLATQ